MVSTKDIYNMFRRILSEHYRMPRPHEIHVHEVVQCMRKSYYERKYGSSDFRHLSDTKCVILGLGLLTHEKLEELFAQTFNAQCEKVVMRDIIVNGIKYKVVGTIDILYDTTLIDLKTVNKIPDRPYSHHYYQLQLYMWLTDLYKSYIVYISKRRGTIRIYEVIRDNKVIDQLIERIHYYIACISSDTIPKREKSYLCNYCEYSLNCELDITPEKKKKR